METIFAENQIQERIRLLGQEISRDYGQETIHAIGMLDGGFIFLADLVRKISSPVSCHFLKMEMVDSGITLDHLVQQLALKNPKSLRTAALVNREDRRRVALPLSYVGFTWNGGHLVGYGLDQNGLFGNLPYLAAMSSISAH